MKPDARTALRLLERRDAFGGPGPVRRVEGIVITVREDGDRAINAACCAPVRGRVPLLFGHSFSEPLGLVEELRLTPAGLWFRARFANRELPYWTQLVWQRLKHGAMFDGISAGILFTARAFQGFALTEISIVPSGAQLDSRAAVHRVSEVYSPDLPLAVHEIVHRDNTARLRLTPSIALDSRYRHDETRYIRDFGPRDQRQPSPRPSARASDAASSCAAVN